ncbi:SDR family oxidoreductase [Photorhabdus noenieputensis]|uniref:SDR family oxidoreductase n=1 Tax=Photorhabdus noenieputensis TaxID=1208607 RepID=UPI001BD481F3|nr:SDR family oxidoreductase [Photorhabdus noenieputensis]MBS9438215.1 SDR family oxidoreductase [Photorhabdus noenieputensis]MCK3668948.1 SDR family oxidoreductase [Photorhabdus noenieputensis]
MKYAFITGATGDIGFAITERLSEDGFEPILLSRTPERLDSAIGKLRNKYGSQFAKKIVCDVSNHEDVKKAFDQLELEDNKLTVLVNCAGIAGGGITAEISPQTWQNVINVNLNGTYFVIHEVLTRKLMSSGGRIINIASTGGKQGVIHGTPYSASKHGVVGLTKSLGLELARNGSGVTVNAVCPGFVESEMAERVREHYAKIWGTDVAEAKRRVEERVPIGRYVEPNEVAEMVAYLASPLAGAVTAQALNVCGGLGNY